MPRFVPVVLVALSLLIPAPTVRADVLGTIFEQVVRELGEEAAKALIDVALANTCQSTTSRAVAVSAERFDSNSYLAFCQPMKVRMEEVRQGDVLFANKEDARHTLTLDVEVEVVVLYPLAQIRYENGEIKLPTPKYVPGFAKPAGERGDHKYLAGFYLIPWSKDYQDEVAAKLQVKALDKAVNDFKANHQSTREYLFKQGVAPELRRLAAAEKEFRELNKKP